MDIFEPKNIIIGIIIILVIVSGVLYFVGSNSGGTPQNSIENLNPPPPQVTETKAMKATIKTAKGDIVLELYPDAAPKTVSNFAKKAQAGYFNGLKFHRVEDWVIQGGDPLSKDNSQKARWGTGGGDIPTELSSKPFIEGALGVARGPDIQVSNDSQFFIVKKDSQFLNNHYTLFGQVTAGMDVVKKIAVGDIIISLTIE